MLLILCKEFSDNSSDSRWLTLNYFRKPKRKELFKLQEVFYKPKDLSKFNLFDKIEKAILQQPAMALDSSYVDDLTYQMYRSKMYENQLFGADSLAFDIQRYEVYSVIVVGWCFN